MVTFENASLFDKSCRFGLRVLCVAVLVFLVLPVLIIIPLSFNGGSFLTFPLEGVSLRWYRQLFASDNWVMAIRNSFLIAAITTVIATSLGTAAAIGMQRLPGKIKTCLQLFIASPVIVPVIISATGLYFLYAPVGLNNSLAGMVLSHTMLAVPFVVVTVASTLEGFDMNLMRAAASSGAAPIVAFRRVMLPLISPGVISGAVFAFAVSFDDIVMAIFLAGPQQRTIPLQMFNGVREEINPTIAAAATILVILSIFLLSAVEYLKHRARSMKAGASGDQ
ncbi:ABC transporter permease [Bordetella sp. 15P40C-2]|uniref:ABC transporter permease n=1 Tax=Bordetella sp. 15P40C-2 TaxID=2572246 RepID=UPI00351B05D5